MMQVCEARNITLTTAMEMTEEELILIMAHAAIQEDARKARDKKSKRR